MAKKEEKTKEELLAEVAGLRLHLDEVEETLRAIRQGEIDALVVSGPRGDQVYLLQGAEHTYRVLVESINEGALALTEGGDIIYCNMAFAGMANTPFGKLVGVSFRDLVSQKDKERFDLLWRNALQGTGADEIELKLNGGRLHVYLSCSARMQDKVLAVFAVVTDITERQTAQEAVRKSHEELERRVEERTIALSNANDEMDLRVQERTKDLVEANQQLIREIEDRKQAEEALLEALEEVRQLKDQLREENLYLREEINLIHSHKDIVGNSEAIRTVFKQIEQVAPTDSTVLVQGETGTGKELLALAIHNLSPRKGRLMITVNCAALPPTLIESELFGREKGAFTGALSKQIGRFELADTSTIFLDEIDALPLELQVKLLRVLESGEFERLGSPHAVKVDVRIISATNCDLAKAVSKGGFREDLYYRLNVFQITVPPLRERREDIKPLVWSFVQEFSKRMGKRIESIPQKDIEALEAYPWPGNVRELRNVTERAMIITTGSVLHLEVPKIAQSAGSDYSATLEEVEKQYIIEVLKTTGWQVSGKDGAAEILGVNPKTLESKIQKLGIQRSKKNT